MALVHYYFSAHSEFELSLTVIFTDWSHTEKLVFAGGLKVYRSKLVCILKAALSVVIC